MRNPPGIGLLIPRSAGDADIVDEADDDTDDDIERGDVFGLSYRGRIAPGQDLTPTFLGLSRSLVAREDSGFTHV